MGDSTYIITNLLDLEAISRKQTGQTDQLLSCLNREKIAYGTQAFQSRIKEESVASTERKKHIVAV